MDYQSLIQLMTSNKTLVKKVTPFLISVSVFSFIFSNSWWHSFLFPFLKFYFSSLPMQVLSHALDKTWIFLICNGIVVVIANTSSTFQYSPSGFDHLNDIKIGDNNSLQPPLLDGKGNSLELPAEPDNINAFCELTGSEEKENDAAEEEQEEQNPSFISDDDGEEVPHAEQEDKFIVTEGGEEKTPELEISYIMGENDREEESETCLMMMMMTEEEEENEEDQEQLYDYEAAEEEEEGMDKLSTEELNKKFEDFIRKMKEELRIQAQQQLILSC